MKNRNFLILSLLFAVSFTMSCYVDTAQDNPFDPANMKTLTDVEAVTEDTLLLSIGFNGSDGSSEVTQNINLPSTGENGTTIRWASSNSSVVSNTGVVTRPAYLSGDVIIILTATIIKNDATDSREFNITVTRAPINDAESVSVDKSNLVIGYNNGDSINSVTVNLTLPSAGSSGTTITWVSGNTSIISNSGVVTRPAYLSGNASVSLTATIIKNGSSDTRLFSLTVIKAPITDEEAVSVDKANLAIGYNNGDSINSVTVNLTLPSAGSSGTIITWGSSNTSIISNSGVVTRPAYLSGDAFVFLTATIRKNGSSDTSVFRLTVIKAPISDQECVQLDSDNLSIVYNGGDSVNYVTRDITLPLTGPNGTTISWISYNTNLITINSNKGVVNNPLLPAANGSVALQATIKKNSSSITKNFNLTVIAFHHIYTAGYGVWKSTNFGATWRSLNSGSYGFLNYCSNDVCVNGSNIYVATTTGIAISNNGGNTWSLKVTDYEVSSIEFKDGKIYAGVWQVGLYISSDGGSSWNIYTTANGLGSNHIHDLFFDGSVLYVGTQSGLSISTNGGTSFTNKKTGLVDYDIHGVYASGSTLYVATYSGVSISTNGGTSWTNYTSAANGLANNQVYDIWVNGSTIYAGTSSGLSKSTTGGTSWNTICAGSAYDVYVYGTTIFSCHGTLSISIDGGTTWSDKYSMDVYGIYVE